MSQIEDLVRQALAETPTAVTATDPLATLDRRVRKARRRLAAGAGAVAAGVVAAVVVPIAVLSGGNDAGNNKVIVGNTPTPAPGSEPGVTIWWPRGAVDVADSAAPGAPSWVLVRDTDKTFIAPIDPNGLEERYAVPEPADYVAPGGAVEWVVGTDGTANTVSVSALNNADQKVTSTTLSGDVVTAPAVVGDSLYVLVSDFGTTSVRQFRLSNDGIDQSQPLAIAGAAEIAATSKGHIWVATADNLVEVLSSGNTLSAGSSVDWRGGDIFGPMGVDSHGDDMWAYDGERIIGLTPKYLTSCVSCAEGYRLDVDTEPSAVATANDGGLYVLVPGSSIYVYPAANVQGDGVRADETLPATGVSSLVAGHSDGVDYVDDLGRLQHWDPQLSASAR